LRRVVDSMDICQSVFLNFFVRAATGELDLSDPPALLRYLVAVARNKVADKVQHHRAARRDQRRLDGEAAAGLADIAAGGKGPGSVVAARDLLAEVRRRLSPEERRLADGRAAGREWAELAAEFGVTPDGVRHRLKRGLDRVVAELGLEDFARE
jgi:RNA polymerase sigma-70 factor (ECF subfamily)